MTPIWQQFNSAEMLEFVLTVSISSYLWHPLFVMPTLCMSFFNISMNLLYGLPLFLPASSVFTILCPNYSQRRDVHVYSKPSQHCISKMINVSCPSDILTCNVYHHSHSRAYVCSAGSFHMFPTLTIDHNVIYKHYSSQRLLPDLICHCKQKVQYWSDSSPNLNQFSNPATLLITVFLSSYMSYTFLIYFVSTPDFLIQYHSFSLGILSYDFPQSMKTQCNSSK